jgi:hypothetical protein
VVPLLQMKEDKVLYFVKIFPCAEILIAKHMTAVVVIEITNVIVTSVKNLIIIDIEIEI